MKQTSRMQIPEWLDTKDQCANCMKLTPLAIQTAKGQYYLCSDQCQHNFMLKAGLKGYNQVRDNDKVKMTSVGNLKTLTATELENLYRFHNNLNRNTMNKLKQGDSLDKVLGLMHTKGRKKKGNVQTRMPFLLEDPELVKQDHNEMTSEWHHWNGVN